MTSLLPNSRRPDVIFHPNGRIDITARIAKVLQLQNGDVIDVAVSYEEYLLYVRLRATKCVGRHEATVHPTNKGKHRNNNFRAYSQRLCKSIRSILNGFPLRNLCASLLAPRLSLARMVLPYLSSCTTLYKQCSECCCITATKTNENIEYD